MRFEAAGAGLHNMYREVNLSGAASATLSFSYHSNLGAVDRIDVQMSSDGGTTYTTLTGGIFNSSNTGPGNVSIDVSSYIGVNTRVRFIEVADGFGGSLFVDDLQIAYMTSGGTTAFSSQIATAEKNAFY